MYRDDPNSVQIASVDQNDLEAPVEAQGQPSESATAGAEVQPTTTPTDTQPILGKFKSADELAKAYENLEALLGKQGAELSEHRSNNASLQKALDLVAPAKQAQQQQEVAPRDFGAELKAIKAKVDTGELSTSDALELTSEITQSKTTAAMQEHFAKQDSQRQTQEAESKFLQENPDFTEAMKSGALEEYKKSNPFHDNFSAYYAYKHDRDTKALAEGRDAAVAEAYAKGKAEVGKIAEGAQVADKTLSKPGSNLRQAKQKFSDSDIKASMLGRLGS